MEDSEETFLDRNHVLDKEFFLLILVLPSALLGLRVSMLLLGSWKTLVGFLTGCFMGVFWYIIHILARRWPQPDLGEEAAVYLLQVS